MSRKFGARRLCKRATVWDREVVGIKDRIRNGPRGPVWILSDSKAAIAAVVNVGRTDRASTGSPVTAVARMVYRVCRRGEGAVKFSWVKWLAGVIGNEKAENTVGWCTDSAWERSVTEGGIEAFWKEAWRVERECKGFGLGRAMEWGRRALTNNTHVRMGKGKIGYWRELIGQRDAGCRRCGTSVEDGNHVVLHCRERARGRQWTSWVEVESGVNWGEAEL